MINVYPYFSYMSDPTDISLDYALFNTTNPVVDGNLTYNNLFDAMVDAVLSAMGTLGFPNLPIVITESGWPSSGNNVATVGNAQTYNNNFIQHVLSTAGTPKRPGASIESFIFAMFNEDQKTGDATEQHFGLFYPDTKLPVYPVQFIKIE
jgi:exo-beta-1,3-glucanase (GH17 family)